MISILCYIFINKYNVGMRIMVIYLGREFLKYIVIGVYI